MADATLSDMMTALSRAHGAGNAGDAASIAQMIKTSYPQETQAMVGSTPHWSQFNPASPGAWAPQVYADTGPVAAAPALPQYTPPNTSPPPGVAALNGEGGAGGPAGSGNWASRTLSDLSDFTRGVVNALPGGNQAAAAFGAGARNITSLTGITTPTTYSDVLNNVQQGQAQAAQNSPVLNTLGGVAGNVDAMALGGAGVAAGAGAVAASGVPFLAPAARAAQGVATYLGAHPFLGGAAAGAAGGAVEGAANQTRGTGSVFDTAAQTALGALGGAVVGKGADLVVTKLAPAAARGWQLLAQKLGSQAASGQLDALATTDAARAALRTLKIDPDELATINAQHVTANGGQPVPLAASLPQYVQGKLASLTKTTPELGGPIAAAAKDWTAQGPTQVPKLIDDAVNVIPHPASPTGNSGVQSIQALENARDSTMAVAMNPIRGNVVPITPNDAKVLGQAYTQVRSRLATLPASNETEGVLSRVTNAIQAVDNKKLGSLSLNDIDQLRQAVGDASPSYESDKLSYKAGQALSLKVGDIGAFDPAYKPALAQYANHQAYIEGFKDGLPGTALEDISGSGRTLAQPTGPAYQQGHASGNISALGNKAAASENGAQSVLQSLAQDNKLRKTIASAYGQPVADKLAGIGAQMSQATANLGRVAPTLPIAAPEHDVTGNVGRAALGLAVHSHFGFLHNAYHAISGMFKGGISDGAAAKLGDMLSSTNPTVQQQAVSAMRARGAADADIARVRAYIAGVGGVNAASRISGQ